MVLFMLNPICGTDRTFQLRKFHKNQNVFFFFGTGQPIFSIDIHPDGSRFATGGLGDGGSSGKVYIWNMTPVMNPKDESDENIPKVLCVMDNHLGFMLILEKFVLNFY